MAELESPKCINIQIEKERDLKKVEINPTHFAIVL